VFKTASFAVNATVLNNFFHSPVMTISDAAACPPMKRLSLQGRVQAVRFSSCFIHNEGLE
jgi:hypothetical protein